MKRIVLALTCVIALVSTQGCAFELLIGDPYTCSGQASEKLAALPTGLPAAFPKYQYVDNFNECDSGGSKGVRFRLTDDDAIGEEVLRLGGCAPSEEFDPEDLNLVMACQLPNLNVVIEVEDPDIWVRPVAD